MNMVPLVRTKLHRPQVPQSALSRPRLLGRLDQGEERTITLVSAPAGSGKTTLVCQWLDALTFPSVWLSLDEYDNDLAFFTDHLIEAIRAVCGDVGLDAESMLQAPQLPPAAYLAATLANDLTECTVGSTVGLILALDDYHVINDETVHAFLSALISNLPPSVHLVIATRVDPPLPLARLRANRQMLEIRGDDLRFTLEEAQVYLENEVGAHLSRETVTILEAGTEGWVVGLRLAAIALRGADDPADFVVDFASHGHVLVMNYLMEEALAYQPAEVVDFLLRTSILERFSAPLCDAVLERQDSHQILDSLIHGNLFVVPLDYEGSWYRYHHLFEQLLRNRLESEVPAEEIATLHARAGDWLIHHGLVEDGLHHLITAGHVEEATRAVAAHRHNLMNDVEWNRLRRWLVLFPRELVERRAHLLISETWLQHRLSRFRGVAGYLERVGALAEGDDPTLSEQERREMQGEIAAIRSSVFYHSGQGQRSLDTATRACQVTPLDHRWVRAEALGIRILASHMVGLKDQAYETLDELYDAARDYEGIYKSYMYIVHMFLAWCVGDLTGLERVATDALAVAHEPHFRQPLGYASHGLGRTYYHWNDLGRAAQYCAQVLTFERNYHNETYLQALFSLALAYQAMGNPDAATQQSQAAHAFALEMNNPVMLLEARTFDARLALLQGRLPDVTPWADQARDFYPHYLLVEVPSMTLAKVLLADGRRSTLEEAEDVLTRLRRAVDAAHAVPKQVEVMALQALLHDLRGEREPALDLLAQSVYLAEPAGYIRLYVDLGPRLADLLDHLLRRGTGSTYLTRYLHRLLETFPENGRVPADEWRSAAPRSGSVKLVEPLTEREREVLELLAQRLTNKEIANQLCIATLTVKKHASNIYEKLGVSGRRQAAAKAKEIGLLPDE